MNPLVSVMIGVYNAAPYLGEAIESTLSQDYEPIELIVVDDGSTDGSADVALSFPHVRVVRQQNGGNGAARNRAVEEATGELYAFLDADDRFTAGKLSLQKAALDAIPASTWCSDTCASSSAPSWTSKYGPACGSRQPSRCRGRHRT